MTLTLSSMLSIPYGILLLIFCAGLLGQPIAFVILLIPNILFILMQSFLTAHLYV